MIDNLVCPSCSGGQLHIVAAERTVTAQDGTQLQYSDTLTACDECRERFYTHDQALASSRARAGVLRQHDGLLTPDEIRTIREQYGISQSEMERMLRVGPKTVVRWEKGTVCQSAAVDTLLTVIRDTPAVAMALAQKVGVEVAATAYSNPWWVLPNVSYFPTNGPWYTLSVAGLSFAKQAEGPARHVAEAFYPVSMTLPIPQSDTKRSGGGKKRRRSPAAVAPLRLVA